MTGAISHKLRSQRGASMLLALLFLLICSMVTASILMAAVSNAGKHRSNLEEHQVYLALSSAVSTLCDELNRCEYRGQYYSWKEPVYNSDGDKIGDTLHFQQTTGAYTYADTEIAAALNPLLFKDFDAIFAQSIALPSGVIDNGRLTGTLVPHTLPLTPNTGISDVDKEVTIILDVDASYTIDILAYLNDLESYKVTAELTPKVSLLPTLPASLPYRGEGIKEQTNPMQWRLGHITIWNDDEEGGAG